MMRLTGQGSFDMFFLHVLWSLLLFSLITALVAEKFTLIDKTTNVPIENVSAWTPDPTLCSLVPDENFNMVPGKYDFPDADIQLEFRNSSDIYLITHGKLVHRNGYGEMTLVDNVTRMSFDRALSKLYWLKNGSIYDWTGAVLTNATAGLIDFEISGGNIVSLWDNQSLTINNEPIENLTTSKICLFPRPSKTAETFYEFIVIPLAIFCFIPLYACLRVGLLSKKLRLTKGRGAAKAAS